MKLRILNDNIICAIGAIIFVSVGLIYPAVQMIDAILDTYKIHALERELWIWQHNKVYCGVCKRLEDIETLMVGFAPENNGSCTFNIRTKNHDGISFEGEAHLENGKLKVVRVGKHPGCAIECDKGNLCDWHYKIHGYKKL